MSEYSTLGGIVLPAKSRGDRATQVGSQEHATGGGVRGTGAGVRIGFESHFESDSWNIFEYRADTHDIIEQVKFEWFDRFGECHSHFIDLMVIRTDGSKIGFAVRPLEKVSKTYLEALARIKEQAMASGFLDDFRLFTEKDICPVELFNAKLFHAYRRPEEEGDTVARNVVENMTGVVNLAQLVLQIGLEGKGFQALVRLMRSGHLEVLNYERISYETLVFKAKEV
jgi:hypothetical protein